jgi:hypothetical protein
MRQLLILCHFCLTSSWLFGQSTVYTFMGGLSGCNQKWDNASNQSMLFKYHGALRIETLNNEEDNASVFAQIGYHVRGSRQRFRFFFPNGGAQNTGINYEFNNLALILGGKSKRDFGVKNKFYYFGGIRGEYTVNTNLSELSQINPIFTIYYPSDGFVQKWILGGSGGAGLELKLKELVGANIEFSIHPDFTRQYRQPALGNVIDPNNPGVPITVGERQIRNISFELSVGLRLIRKVVYED